MKKLEKREVKIIMNKKKVMITALATMVAFSAMHSNLALVVHAETSATENVSNKTEVTRTYESGLQNFGLRNEDVGEKQIYTVKTSEELLATLDYINGDVPDTDENTVFTIEMLNDIYITNSRIQAIMFKKNVTLLGNGYTLNLGKHFQNKIMIDAGKTLSLGRENPSNVNENKLTITADMENLDNSSRNAALVYIKNGTVNMYDGVKLTGNTTFAATLGSGVNIVNGTFNMYGGEICGNTNETITGLGGAVVGYGSNGNVTFNMYGGSIHDNKTSLKGTSYSGAVLMANGNFSMQGGTIKGNTITMDNEKGQSYGGGALIFGGKTVLSGGSISENTGATFGGGIYTGSDADIEIKNGFKISDNSSLVGGGICNNGSNVVAESGAVIANNIATAGGDDIAHYGNSLKLAPAKEMNERLTTDNSNELITGWYIDKPRWHGDSEDEVDVTSSIGKTKIFLKAAYKNRYLVNYNFGIHERSNKSLPQEVLKLLPKDAQEYKKGEKVVAIIPEQTCVPVEDGIWEFIGYDAHEKIVESKVTEFHGVWKFVPYMTALNEAPVINAKDKIIVVGEKFDPLKDVTAIDREDGDLTNKIEIINNTVDTTKPGIYEVKYRVTDKNGISAVKTIIVTVNEKSPVPEEKPENGHGDMTEENTGNESGNTTTEKPENTSDEKPLDAPLNESEDDLKDKPVSPETGDLAGLGMMSLIFAGSGGTLLGLRKKKKNKKNK